MSDLEFAAADEARAQRFGGLLAIRYGTHVTPMTPEQARRDVMVNPEVRAPVDRVPGKCVDCGCDIAFNRWRCDEHREAKRRETYLRSGRTRKSRSVDAVGAGA